MTGEAATSERTITSNSLRANHRTKTTTISSAARLKNSVATMNGRPRTSSAANSGNSSDRRSGSVRISSAPPTSKDSQTRGGNKTISVAQKWSDASRTTAGVSIRNGRLKHNGSVIRNGNRNSNVFWINSAGKPKNSVVRPTRETETGNANATTSKGGANKRAISSAAMRKNSGEPNKPVTGSAIMRTSDGPRMSREGEPKSSVAQTIMTTGAATTAVAYLTSNVPHGVSAKSSRGDNARMTSGVVTMNVGGSGSSASNTCSSSAASISGVSSRHTGNVCDRIAFAYSHSAMSITAIQFIATLVTARITT